MPLQSAASPGRARPSGRAVALGLSVALHALVLGALALRGDGAGSAQTARTLHVRLVPAPGTLVVAPDGAGLMSPRRPSLGTRVWAAACRGGTYTGIGARVNAAGYIIDMAPDGPAEHAGLQPGDAILNIDDLPIDVYPVGHTVALRLLRDGRQAHAVVRIGTICNEPPATVA